MSIFDTYRRGFRRLIGACTGVGLLLTRWHIFDNRYFGVYVHRLAQSDEERAQHDHPWSFLSIILTNGYYDVTPQYKEYRTDGTVSVIEGERYTWRRLWSFHRAEDMHRLELPHGVTWTLVFRGPERRRWGFWPINPVTWLREWMDHEEYARKFCQ